MKDKKQHSSLESTEMLQFDDLDVSGRALSTSMSPVSLDGETWKDVYGYEGLYRVSNLGRIMSILKTPRILKQWSGGGNPMVTLCADGIKHKIFVSNIVGGTFIGFPHRDKNECYNHLNKDKWDNRVVNLSIETKQNSVLLSYHEGVLKDWGIKNVGKKTRFIAKQKYRGVDKNGTETIFTHSELLEKYGTGVRAIVRCLAKEKYFNTAYGKKWYTIPLSNKEKQTGQ
jgi:hypothetical protein